MAPIVLVPLSLAVLMTVHFFDLASFVVMIDMQGLAAEANPIVLYLHDHIGVSGLSLLKIAVLTFGSAVFVMLAPQRRRLAMAIAIYGIAAGLVGSVSNVATIYS